MIARIQQIVVLAILAGLTAWGVYVFPSFYLFFIALLVVAGVYIAYIAMLFIVIHRVNRSDPEARATLLELLQACLREAFTAPAVFLWRQPFRTQHIPDFLPESHSDSSKQGVVFIHGFFCNRAFWAPWMAQLQSQNRAFAAVTLEPAFGSIDDYVSIVDDAVLKVTQVTGQPPLVICHSMGGLVARAWLRMNADNDHRVGRIVTIGTPHFGTALSFEKAILPFVNTLQMQRMGAWTQLLAKTELPARYSKFTCWYSNCDNIVVPTSTAMLPGADNRLVVAQGHVSMSFSPLVMQTSLALLLA